MTKQQSIFGVPFLLAGGDDTSATKEIQVLKAGRFKHPVYGDIAITPEDLRAFKENFEKNVRRTQIPFNYEHGQSVAHGTKAAGWVQSLSLKNEGKELWATPDWTAAAKQGIEQKEWKYSSAEILWKWTDPETGTVHDRVLIGVALTNNPFIKGMDAIAAHETNEQEEGKEAMKLNELTALLLSEHGINLTELQAAAVQAKLVPGLQADVVKLGEQLATSKDSVKALEKTNAELTQKVELSEKAADAVKFSALVEKGMKDGKLTKVFAEGKLKALFDKHGLQFCEELVADMPKAIQTVGDMSGSGAEGEKADTRKFSDVSEEVAVKAQELADKEKISFSEASTKLLKSDKDLAKRYAEFGNA